MLLTTLGQRSTGSSPLGTQLTPQDGCLGYPPFPKTFVAHTVRSSAKQTRLTGSVGLGMSAMYKLNRDGDSLEPCGTPVLIFIDVDFTPLKQVLACLSLR